MAANSNSNVQQPFTIRVNCHPHPLGLLNPGKEGGGGYTCKKCMYMDGGRRYSCRTCNDYSMHVECAVQLRQPPPPTTTTSAAPSSSRMTPENLAMMAAGLNVAGIVAGHQINNAIDAAHHHTTGNLDAGHSTAVDPTPAVAVDHDHGILESGIPDDNGGIFESVTDFFSNFM